MSEASDGEWFGGKRWTGYAAIGMIAVLLLCAAFVAYRITTNHHATTTTPITNTGAGKYATSRSHAAATDANTSQAVPSDAPPSGISWALVNGYAAPTSPTDGPRHVDGVAASGYGHTPTGALLAVGNFIARSAAASASKTDCAAEADAAFGVNNPATATAKASCQTPDSAPQPLQIVGYAYVSYTSDQAVITIAIRFEQTASMVEVTTTLHWTASSWLLSPTNLGGSGNPLGPTASISSLSGLVAWAGA